MTTSSPSAPLLRSPRQSRRSRQPAVALTIASLTQAHFQHFQPLHPAHRSAPAPPHKMPMDSEYTFDFPDYPLSWPPTPTFSEQDDAEEVGAGCPWSADAPQQSLHRTSSNDSFHCRGLGMFNVPFNQHHFEPTLKEAATMTTAAAPPPKSSQSLLAHASFADAHALNHLSSPIDLSELTLVSTAMEKHKRRKSTLLRRRKSSSAGKDDEDKANVGPEAEEVEVHPGRAARRMRDFTAEAGQRSSPSFESQGSSPPFESQGSSLPSESRDCPPARPPRPEAAMWNIAFTDMFPSRRSSFDQSINPHFVSQGLESQLRKRQSVVEEAADSCSPLQCIIGVPRPTVSSDRSRMRSATFQLDLHFAIDTFTSINRDQSSDAASPRLPHKLSVRRHDTISSIKQRLAATLNSAGIGNKTTTVESLIVSLRSSEVAPVVSPRLRLNSIVDYDAVTPPSQAGAYTLRKGSAPLPSPPYTTLLWAAAARRRVSATPAMTFSSSSSSSSVPIPSTRRQRKASISPSPISSSTSTNTSEALTDRWSELKEDEATLADVGVTPRDQLVVALRQASYAHF